MYPAIQANADRIAQAMYQIWIRSGDYEKVMNDLLIEANMADWRSTVLDAFTQVIKENHLNAHL
jgi:hypothetical protein